MATKKTVSKKAQKPVVVKKPVREVQKAPLGEVLVTLDRVIAFLDHATTALNAHTLAVNANTAEIKKLLSEGTPVFAVHGNAAFSKEAIAKAKIETPVAPVQADKLASAPVAEVAHTPSYEIVMKKLPQCSSHDAVEILIGQINNSVKLRADEKTDLLERCQARKDLIPF